MKERFEYLIYKIAVKFLNVFWRVWQNEQISKFAKCGVGVYIGKNSRFTSDHIYIGNNIFIGENANFMAALSNIYIGNDVTFGPHVTIIGGDHRTDIVGKLMNNVTNNEKVPENDADVYIEDDVWIGANVTILKGVRIGSGSVIGAGSIVIKDVSPYTIHVGCPGVKEKPRFNAEQIAMHKRLIKNS